MNHDNHSLSSAFAPTFLEKRSIGLENRCHTTVMGCADAVQCPFIQDRLPGLLVIRLRQPPTSISFEMCFSDTKMPFPVVSIFWRYPRQPAWLEA